MGGVDNQPVLGLRRQAIEVVGEGLQAAAGPASHDDVNYLTLRIGVNQRQASGQGMVGGRVGAGRQDVEDFRSVVHGAVALRWSSSESDRGEGVLRFREAAYHGLV